MALSDQDKREIKEIVESCLCSHYEAYGMTAHNHSQDHEFISNWRTSTNTVKRAGIWAAVGIVVSGAIGFFIAGIKNVSGG